MRVKLLTLFPLIIISTVSCSAEEHKRQQRSIATGRGQFRPAKREVDWDTDEWSDELQKRSLALGRLAFRPGKRSLALGRVNFRPGKRNVDVEDQQIEELMEDSMGKRSAAFGRVHFRPGKRSLALGRSGFRPGKRSLALGRVGFRPGKRAALDQPSPLCSVDLRAVWDNLLDLLKLYEDASKNCGQY